MSEKPKQRTGLGRGLGALLKESDNKITEDSFLHDKEIPQRLETFSSINEIPVSQIETNPFQPRLDFDETALNELAESIRVQGIIQPITVRQLASDKYQLISGERRYQASKRIGLQKIPAYIRTADDQQMLEMALIENIQRENLNAIEVALSYQRLMHECSLKQEELGDRVGKNRSTVNNYMRLLKLPDVIQASLRDNKISMGHARALVSIENADDQLAIFYKTVSEELSVRKVEEAVRELTETTPVVKIEKKEKVVKNEILSLQNRLQAYFGTNVSVKANNKSKGEITIPFTTQEELDRILLAMNA
ncbi:MAG: ParB/RepB/Spo0J family partition protein [Pseudarcicella sp.]|nr:ParB/RepB/Spo0J family partition protein [Pseudarcicella sp.]MBP6410548.1 ParB/RepB/Spo0J family partition protein [Pseudarcicella sp.]